MMRTRKLMKLRVPAILAAAAIVAMAGTAVALTGSGSSAQPQRGAASGEPWVDHVPADVVADLGHYGIELSVAPHARAAAREQTGDDPTVAAGEAVDAARNSMGLPQGDDPVSVALIELSTPTVGRELEPDLDQPSRVDPEFTDRPAWAVVFRDVPVSLHGPYDGPEVADATGTMVVMVDPETGSFLHATVY